MRSLLHRTKQRAPEYADLLPMTAVISREIEPGRGVVVVCTGSVRGEGVTLVAGRLAAALATFTATLYLAADEGDSRQAPAGCTMTTVSALQQEGLRLHGEALAGTVDHLRQRYGALVVDAPPPWHDPLAPALAPLVDRIYVIARAGVTRGTELARTTALLGTERVSGVILTDVRGLTPAWLRRMVA